MNRISLSESTERAIEACYDASLQPATWSHALQQLAESVGGESCNLFCHTKGQGKLPTSTAHFPFAEIWLRNQEFAPDPHVERCGRLYGLGRKTLLEHDVSTDQERRTLPYYQEIARPAGHDWYEGVSFWIGAAVYCLPVYRRAKQGPFTRKEAQYLGRIAPHLARIAPHLARIVRLARHYSATSLSSGLSALERLTCAALAIGERGAVIDMNQTAQRLLGADLMLMGGRLIVRDRLSNQRLQQLITEAVSSRDSIGRVAEPAMIERLEAPRLLAEAMPVTALGSDLFNVAASILLLTDLTAPSEVDEARLRFAFSLTEAEAKLAARIASGNGIDAAAASLSISRETARSQLKAVFAKTRTERQAELASLVSRVSRTKRI